MNTADRIRVLLLEDSDSDAFLVRTALRHVNSQFEISRVETLREARAALQDSQHFDVFIGDLNLPDSSHDNTLAFLLHEREHIPVVILNSCDDPLLERKCEVAGAVCYSKQKLLDKEFIQIVRDQLKHVTQ